MERSHGHLDKASLPACLVLALGKVLAATRRSSRRSRHMLTLRACRTKAKLLDNLTGYIGPGFTAIMGPSGAGKSTLLNVLACRMDKGATQEGKVRLNGQTYELTHLKRMVSWAAGLLLAA